MLNPLANSGFPPGTPLAPGMTTSDIGIPRCHFQIAGQASANSGWGGFSGRGEKGPPRPWAEPEED